MNFTLHTNLIRETLAYLARTAADADDTANTNALNQAAFQVSRGVLANVVADVTGDLLIPSKGDTGTVYRVGERPCTCTAGRKGQPCWHSSLFEAVNVAAIDVAAIAVAAPVAAPSPALVAKINGIGELMNEISDAELDSLAATYEQHEPADAWEAYCAARARGESASWEPDDVAYWFGDK
jgi:hypothetical protein